MARRLLGEDVGGIVGAMLGVVVGRSVGLSVVGAAVTGLAVVGGLDAGLPVGGAVQSSANSSLPSPQSSSPSQATLSGIQWTPRYHPSAWQSNSLSVQGTALGDPVGSDDVGAKLGCTVGSRVGTGVGGAVGVRLGDDVGAAAWGLWSQGGPGAGVK